jgi:soluble lytic murein transglycosylase-like protein
MTTKLLPKILQTTLTAGMILTVIATTVFAENPDHLYQRFLKQQMMVAKIKEINKDPTAASLKVSLAKEARSAGMAIPDWFYGHIQKPRSHPKVQPPSTATATDNEIERYIQNASKQYGVNPALIKAVIHVESAFNAEAISRAGAKGLMQIMDSTGVQIGLTDPFDPRANVYGGTRLLKTYLVRYQSLKKSLIAYNAGEKYVNHSYSRLPRETRSYVPKVIKYYYVYEKEYGQKNKHLYSIEGRVCVY